VTIIDYSLFSYFHFSLVAGFNYPTTPTVSSLGKKPVNKTNKRGVRRRATQNKTPSQRSLPVSGQVMVRMSLRGLPLKLTSTVTTGVIADSTALNAASSTLGIPSFNTRFSPMFLEYRINSIKLELIPLGIYTGVTYFFINEKSIGTPTYLDAFTVEASAVKNNEQSTRNFTLHWKNQDFSDAQWVVTSANNFSSYLNTYTDNANLGSPVTATELWIIRPTFDISFRGLAN
jgi:hypothetical protein